ncbi:uncharacterized protein LOC111519212 [Drosophila willistoni]|uniref:uncharacterized protein LOC111519212 n=1 Tax=Drosophila willistoni TaxID=7260 RepID=UPI001F073E17|nr:uncharacterized protein LOC111519212 [Drosophila willistoni]
MEGGTFQLLPQYSLRRISSRFTLQDDNEKGETRKTHKGFSIIFDSPKYVTEQEGALISSIEDYKYQQKEPKHFERLPSGNPSFAQFKVSYNVLCDARYKKARKVYNAQIHREIKNLIKYSETASDAAALVRWTSYTSWWPPYHNLTELKQTSETFFKLSDKEQKRFTKIMNTDYV